MSNKIEKTASDLSTKPVDNNSPGYGYNPPALDELGRVILSPVSMVAMADSRAVTMGERVRKYQKTPQFLQDQLRVDNFDDDKHDPDTLADPHEMPMSPHEDRHADLLERTRVRKAKEADDAKKLLLAKEKEEKEAFRKRMQELQAEGTIPVRANPPNEAERAQNAGEA